MAARSAWQCWFPAPALGKGGGWRLIRFESVDAAGKPVGAAIPNLAPGGQPRLFRTESAAQFAADEANRLDGYC